eukprot:183064_1
MLSKFGSVPTDFEQKNAINVRTAKRSVTTNKVSFRNTIRNTCEYLVWGYATTNNLQMPKQTLHVPHEIKQICFNYFIGDFPACASIYDDQLSNSNEKAKTELVQASLNLLCSATITQTGSKLLVAHFIDLLAYIKKPNKVLSTADINRMFPFKKEWSLKIEHGEYFR